MENGKVIHEEVPPAPPEKPTIHDMKKIDNWTEKAIEDFVMSTSEKDDVENLYALIVNFIGTDQGGSEAFAERTQLVYSSLKKVIESDENIEYLVANETYSKEGVDGISEIQSVILSAQKIAGKMTCKDRIILYIQGHGVDPSNGGGIATLEEDGIFYPQNFTQYFPECPEPTIYYFVSSCFGGQYRALNLDQKVRAYLSDTGEYIVSYSGGLGKYSTGYNTGYGYAAALSSDLEKYAPLYKQEGISTDDLILLSHLSAVSKDTSEESPRAHIKTDILSRKIISDLLLKESFCTESNIKEDNIENITGPASLFLEKQNQCIQTLDKLLGVLESANAGSCQEAVDKIDSIISELQNFQEIGDLRSYYDEREIEDLKLFRLFDETKLDELKIDLENRFASLRDKIIINLNHLRFTISKECPGK